MDKVNAIGGLLKRIENYNKMQTFQGRLIFQKSIYLLQEFDLYLGYNFSWYVRGPYCSDLTKDGYKLRSIYDRIPLVKFKESVAEERFNNFLEFLGIHKNDADWLEIIASIHFLYKRGLSKKDILDSVQKKQEYFTKIQCEEAWNYLKSWRMVE